MPHRRHHRGDEPGADEAPSPRPAGAGCYAFLRSASSLRAAAGGYRRLDPAPPRAFKDADAAVRVEVGPAAARKERSVFHVDPAVLDAGPVRRLVAAAGRRLAGGGVSLSVDALLFEHLLWLAATEAGGGEDASEAGCSSDDLSEIVEFYSQEDDEEAEDDHHHRFKC